MPMPKKLSNYEAEWGAIAEALSTHGTFTIPARDRKVANFLRLRFYGFRNALESQDADNPWVGVLMETQATVDAEGNLVLTRSPLSTLLRGLLEHSRVAVPDTSAAAHSVDEPVASQSDKALLEYLGRRDDGAG